MSTTRRRAHLLLPSLLSSSTSRSEETTAPPAAAAAAGGNDLQIADGEIESNWETVIDNFDNMDLRPELLRGVYAYG